MFKILRVMKKKNHVNPSIPELQLFSGEVRICRSLLTLLRKSLHALSDEYFMTMVRESTVRNSKGRGYSMDQAEIFPHLSVPSVGVPAALDASTRVKMETAAADLPSSRVFSESFCVFVRAFGGANFSDSFWTCKNIFSHVRRSNCRLR